MAKFEARFGLGDHVWTVLDCNWDDPAWPTWAVFEHVIDEVRFIKCPGDRVRYCLHGCENLRRESELFETLEDAVTLLPRRVTCYALFRVDDKGDVIDKGVRVEIKHS